MKCLQSNRVKDLLALEIDKLRIGIKLLTGHISLRGHLHKLGFAEQRADCAGRRARIVFTSCATALRSLAKDRFWGRMFLEPGDLAEKRVSSLIGLVSNTRLGLTIQPY